MPRGGKMARCHAVALSYYANGNVLSKVHLQLISDTRFYHVEFMGGKVTELNANAIVESM